MGSDTTNLPPLGDERTSIERHFKSEDGLFTTLHREFLKARRRQTRFSHSHLEEPADQLPFLSSESADRTDGCEVLRALAKLSEIHQAAVALFYLDECSYKDIAQILDVPLGTVKSRIARGIVQLRGILSYSPSDPTRSEGPTSLKESAGHPTMGSQRFVARNMKSRESSTLGANYVPRRLAPTI